MSAWQAQSASMALEGTVLTSSFFHLFTQGCTSGTTAALGPISSWYISSNLSKSWAVFGEASQYLGIKPKDFGTFTSDQSVYPAFPLLNDLNTVQIWLPEKNPQGHQKDNYLWKLDFCIFWESIVEHHIFHILSLVKYFMKNVFAIASVLSENIQHTINELNHCKYIQFFLLQGTTPIVSHCATRAEFLRHRMYEPVSLNAIMTHESQTSLSNSDIQRGFPIVLARFVYCNWSVTLVT